MHTWTDADAAVVALTRELVAISSESSRTNAAICEHGLDQLVKGPTRIRTVAGSLQQSTIDLVFYRTTVQPSIEIEPSAVSDHHVIRVLVPTNECMKIKFDKHVVVDWRNFNETRMNNELREALKDVPLTITESLESIDRDLTIAIITAMNTVIPKRIVHTRRNTDVINYHIEAVRKKRDRLIKKAHKTGNPKVMVKVKELNHVIKSVVKRERDRIIRNKIKDSSPKTFWKTVNDLIGKFQTMDEMKINDDAGDPLGPEDTSQAFSVFFKEKVDKLIAKNPIEDEEPRIEYEKIPSFTDEELQKALSSFKPKKSSGPDEIPMLVIKTCFDCLKPWIVRLFEKIIQVGYIPDTWKLARLKPIFKKGDRPKAENYRPISNLSSVSKLFERCLLNRIAHLETDGPNQHGFKAHHSTTSAAIELQSHIASILDKNKLCLVYSMDLSAAFDLIRPGIFVKKALSVVPSRGIIHLILDFITKRKAFVEVNTTPSSTFTLEAGCPHGSTIGPKVFNIYCNDLFDHIKDAFFVSYADDSYVVVEADTITDLKLKTEEVINSHVNWLKENGMVCNIEKTEIMLMRTDLSMDIEIEGRKVKTQQKMNVLGIQFDSDLSWDGQVSKVISKNNRILHGLRLIRRHFNKTQMTQILTSFYYSILYYGIEVWYHRGLSFHLKHKIKSAHYRAMRVIYGNLGREELDEIGRRATPDEWSNYALGKFLAKMIITTSPGRLCKSSVVNAYSVRRQPGRLMFFDSSTRKIGRQALKNRVTPIANQMKFKWLHSDLDSLRPRLKKCFFSYCR